MDAPSKTRPQPDAIDRALTGVDRAVGRLIAQLVTDDREESLRVLRGLLRLGPMAVDFLADAYTRNPRDARLRCRIVSALMAFGSVPAARPAAVQAMLSARLQEHDPTVVMRIQVALAQLAPSAEERAAHLATIPAGRASSAEASATAGRVAPE